jgi:hypothetical protein
MDHDRDTLSEAEAQRLWRRAAELQAEAARRAEVRVAEEETGEDGGPHRREGDGYALVHVRAAAVEAGIGEGFVEAALAEVRAERAVSEVGGAPRRPISRWVLGNPSGAVTARRVVRATPRAILAAMEDVLPHDPFRLTLRDRMGDPLQGGVLIFDIQGASFTGTGGGFIGDASFADLRQVLVTVAAQPDTPPATSVTVTAPVAWAWRLNAGLTLGLTTLGGVLGIVLVGSVAGGLGFLGPVGAGLLTALSGTAAASGALTGFRALHRYGLGRGERALDSLLAAVAARAEGGWGIAPKDDGPSAP